MHIASCIERDRLSEEPCVLVKIGVGNAASGCIKKGEREAGQRDKNELQGAEKTQTLGGGVD